MWWRLMVSCVRLATYVTVLNTFITYPPINGAYTEIFAGLSPAITMKETGDWGKFLILIYSLTDSTGMESCSTNPWIQCFSCPLGPTSSHPPRLTGRDQDGGRGREWLCEEILGVDWRPGSEVYVIDTGALIVWHIARIILPRDFYLLLIGGAWFIL